MIVLNVKSKSGNEKDTHDIMMKACESLVGWQPYIDSEVLISDVGANKEKPGTFTIIIGPEKGDDTDCEFDVEA